MSEHKMIKQLKRIFKMPVLRSLSCKEVFNTKEAGLYLGLSPDYVCTLARKNAFPSSRPKNGRRCYKKRDLDYWLFSKGRESMFPISEAEKMAILHPQRN
jgi:hypothetical protein